MGVICSGLVPNLKGARRIWFVGVWRGRNKCGVLFCGGIGLGPMPWTGVGLRERTRWGQRRDPF